MSTPATPSNEFQDESTSRPFLRFFHSDALRAKTLTVLTTLEQAKDATRHRSSLADLVVELTNAGMDYYFMRPLKLAQVGFVVEQSARVAMSGAIRVMAGVIQSIIGRMDRTQLLLVSSTIREMME
jgi:hypothetical protein